jgi:hypothetical protein
MLLPIGKKIFEELSPHLLRAPTGRPPSVLPSLNCQGLYISYVFSGTLARRKKTFLGKLAIKIRVRHDTPHAKHN